MALLVPSAAITNHDQQEQLLALCNTNLYHINYIERNLASNKQTMALRLGVSNEKGMAKSIHFHAECSNHTVCKLAEAKFQRLYLIELSADEITFFHGS